MKSFGTLTLLALVAATGFSQASCSSAPRGGDDSLHSVPDAAASPALSPSPEPPLGSATHP
jgi:hypothetical protein